MYARNDGKKWIPTMLLTAGLFPLACFSVAAILNTIAIGYHSLAAVPFGTIVVLLLIWLLLSFPLCLLGTVRLCLGGAWADVCLRSCCCSSQSCCCRTAHCCLRHTLASQASISSPPASQSRA